MSYLFSSGGRKSDYKDKIKDVGGKIIKFETLCKFVKVLYI